MSNVPATMTTCPDEETLAAFIDGRLKQDARNELMEHIAGCAECRDVMAAARELESENVLESGNVLEPENVRQFPPRRSYARIASAAIAAGIIGVALIPNVREQVRFTYRVGFAPVKSAYQSQSERRVQSRLSGLPYKQLKRIFRGSNDETDDLVAMADMIDAASKLEIAASKDSWKQQRELARAEINIGEYDEAVRAIELAERAGGSDDAGFLNDAAAVYLERARNPRQPEDRVRAFKAAERAWARAKTPESAWNRALAYEVSGRSEDAIRAWKAYLAMDSTSEWAKEAQTHLHDLEEISAQP